MIRFELSGPRTPSAFAKALDHWYDLALLDPLMVRKRVRRFGADAGACGWPVYWLEWDGVGLLLEERQVTIPAGPGKIAAGLQMKWGSCLDVVAGVDAATVRSAIDEDAHVFLAAVLVAVHQQPAGTARRPSLDSGATSPHPQPDSLSPRRQCTGASAAGHQSSPPRGRLSLKEMMRPAHMAVKPRLNVTTRYWMMVSMPMSPMTHLAECFATLSPHWPGRGLRAQRRPTLALRPPRTRE